VVEGALYSRTKLKNSYMALNQLRYFEEIDFQSEKGPDETLTDVNIRIKERRPGCSASAPATAPWTMRSLRGRSPSRTSSVGGQTLSLKASLGSSTQLYDISFTEPWLFDMPLWSKFDIWNLYREYDTYNLDSKGFGATSAIPSIST